MKMLQLCTTLCALLVVMSCSKSDDSAEEQLKIVDKTANLLGTGKSANDILSNGKFTKLKIEIAYVVGFKPKKQTIDELVRYLKLHTFKENIETVYLELTSPDEDDLTVQEIADLETENRTVYNDGETLGIYIYFADSPSDGDDLEEGVVTLGAVYRNTSMVIYERTVKILAGRNLLITDADVEIATVNHEFGHLFGLVNLGTPAVNNHEDSEAANHCTIEGCIMRAKLQFGGSGKSNGIVSKNELKSACSLSGNSVLEMLENNVSKGLSNWVPLGEECVIDLKANGGR